MCGLDVVVDGGRVVSVTGDRRGPTTEGFVCGKVRKIAAHLYGDERVRTPLVRDGARGTFRVASWEEALALVASRLGEIRDRSGGEAILPFHYGGSNGWLSEGGLASRFFHRLGATNLLLTFCAAATTAASQGLYGMMPGVALEDYVHAKLIVLWGVNPSATGIHLVPIIERARAAGAKLVVIDPRRTALARGADLHLAPRPGTDLPVALALIDALFSRGLADEGFLAAHATGVGELRRRAARWSLAAAAEIAGIEVAAIERFLAMYVEGAPAVIRAGWGLERNRNGGSAVAAVLALPAVAGKLGVRGGGFTMSNSSPGPRGWSLDPTAAIGAPPPATRTINMAHLGSALATTVSPRIEAVFVYNCNPAVTAPNQAEVIRELSRDDRFVVVHEQVMTDTARLADVVLPATHFLEHREIARGYGTMRLYDSAAVAEPEGEARSNTAVFGELLRRMGLDRPGEPMDDEGLAAAIFASDPRGAALRMALDAQGVAAPQPGSPQVPFVDAWPGTEDRKIHLVPEALDREAPAGLYGYQADPATAAYPLALISPALATQISSTFGQLRASPAAIELAPEDAAARGLRDGDPVRAWNALAEVRCAVRVNPDVRPGVAVLTKGTWRRFTSNGLGANALIPETTADLGGQAAFNDARIEVARAEGGAP